MPTSSDLVADLPADFEVFGQAVDTSLVDLKGGTTNQVLAKNSDTDMDFKWVTDATGMTNPMTTTGDMIYSSSGSTPARLGIGTSGQVIGIAAGVPAWTTPAAGGGMTLISTTAMTGSSITLSSITGTYKDLIVLINNATMNTGDAELTLDFNGAGNLAAGTGRFKTSLGDFQDDVIKFTLGNNTTRTVAQNHYCIIKNYASTTAFKPFEFSGSAQLSSGGVGGSIGGGAVRTTSAITSLVIANNQGRTFSAGEILLYGAN